MKCSRCEVEAVIRQGNQWLCDKHYRFGSMRAGSKRRGKYVPSHVELEKLFDPKMLCPDCGVSMNWRAKDGQCTVATLQHYRDGTLAIVCRSCNTRHAFMKDDDYRQMPKDHKFCKKCNLIHPLKNFSKDNNRAGTMKLKSYCKSCSNSLVEKWKEKNRDKYNEYQRLQREKLKDKESKND